ncbi:MAG: hypothetical protein Q9165_000783 [Trypethelium subeluteriae]
MSNEEATRIHSASQSQQDETSTEKPATKEPENQEPHEPWFKSIWSKLGLDIPTILIMMKGGLAPTIGLAIAAIAVLALWSSVQARIHTTRRTQPGTGGPGTVGTPSPGAQTGGYNSSQSAVCAIWLFFQVYLINALKSKYPQLQFPSIIWSIFAIVSMSYGPNFTTASQALNFARTLLITYLSGFGIAFGVSLFVIPMNSRKIVFKIIPGYIGALRGALKVHSRYVESLEHTDVFLPTSLSDESQSKGKPTEKPHINEAMAFKKSAEALSALIAKLHGELPFAKREIAIGKLGPDDLNELLRLLRETMIPVMGLSSVADIFERASHWLGWDHAPMAGDDPNREKSVQDWNELAKLMHEPVSKLTQIMDEGLHHTLLKLQFIEQPKSSKSASSSTEPDVEAKGDAVQPGDLAFGDYMDMKIQEFEATKQPLLRKWCELHGIDLPPDFFEKPAAAESILSASCTEFDKKRRQRQMYLVLYIELLLASTGRAILELVYFADLKARSGKMDRNRLIAPGYKRLRKWLNSVFSPGEEDSSDDLNNAMHEGGGTDSKVYMGAGYQQRKDPEHLPPQNVGQQIGDYVRLVPKALGSTHSSFGFRTACATISLGILGYLESTHVFYTKQRVFWAVIMIGISMTPTAGQSLWNFMLRILGTFIAMVLSYVAWYIVDGHRAGVLVFYWLFCSMGFYVPLKFPRYAVAGVISIVTLTLILGYELQVAKVGVKFSTSNGQPYYPTYELAPYRLATVVAGLFVAFIWTIFPYPITEHSQLRRHLGSSLYLLANLYSVAHETIRYRIQGEEGDIESKDSPARHLEKARTTIFTKQTVLLGQMQQVTSFLKWEIPMGGRIQNYTALLSYSSRTFHDMKAEDETQWIQDFRQLLKSASLTSYENTSLLSLLSSSITTGQPLPPYLKTAAPYALTEKLEGMDRDILSIRHLAEPGYAAFAMMQITTRCVVADIGKLLALVRELIGEIDFSFHTINVADESEGSQSQDSIMSNDKGKQE